MTARDDTTTWAGWMDWVDGLIYPDDYTTAARKAGFDKSTMTRWKQGGRPDPDRALMLAREYGANPVEALVATGLLSEAEAQLRTRSAHEALREVTDDALLNEVEQRIKASKRGSGNGSRPAEATPGVV